MTAIDLTALVDAAARQQWANMTRSNVAFDDLAPHDQHSIRSLVLPTVALVAPMAEQQTRDLIATALLTAKPLQPHQRIHAARIARGEAT